MRDAIIVGAGIIGATLARALRNDGKDVLLLDDGRPNAGTPPSGGHLKPSWFGGMPKAEYEPAMKLLDDVWGLEEASFEIRAPLVGKVASATVYRVDTDVVIQEDKTLAVCTSVLPGGKYPTVRYELKSGYAVGTESCRLLLVAAGAWCSELLPDVDVTVKQGVSFRIKGTSAPFVLPWAPYKQIVVHQQTEDELWAGDGTAVLPKNWTAGRTASCRIRCQKALGGTPVVNRVLTGFRPYCATEGTDPCLLRKVGPSAWVATGAGKSGTIAAGWVARRILDQAK